MAPGFDWRSQPGCWLPRTGRRPGARSAVNGDSIRRRSRPRRTNRLASARPLPERGPPARIQPRAVDRADEPSTVHRRERAAGPPGSARTPVRPRSGSPSGGAPSSRRIWEGGSRDGPPSPGLPPSPRLRRTGRSPKAVASPTFAIPERRPPRRGEPAESVAGCAIANRSPALWSIADNVTQWVTKSWRTSAEARAVADNVT